MVRPLISIVIPQLNESACLPDLYAGLCRACDPLPYEFEFLFVDDGSTDDSIDVLSCLHQRDARVAYLALSRNFGHQSALSAGLAHAAGAAVIMMDGDLQHPPALIPELLERWCAGFDVVNTRRLDTEGVSSLKRLGSFLFYRLFNRVTNVRIEPGGADFRLMSRRAVDELNAMPERHRFVRGLVPWIGFRQTSIPFYAPRRFAGRSRISFGRNLRFALDGVTSFSLLPLHMFSLVGWSFLGSSLAFGAVASLTHLAAVWSAPVWMTLVACMAFFSGIQLALLGMMGEYLGRILEQVKGRPLYVVREAMGLKNRVRRPPMDVRPPMQSNSARVKIVG